jgi:hypothetical protein
MTFFISLLYMLLYVKPSRMYQSGTVLKILMFLTRFTDKIYTRSIS